MLKGDSLVGLVKALAGATDPITVTGCAVVLLIVFTTCCLALIVATCALRRLGPGNRKPF